MSPKGESEFPNATAGQSTDPAASSPKSKVPVRPPIISELEARAITLWLMDEAMLAGEAKVKVNDRLQKLYCAVVPSDEKTKLNVTDVKNPDKPGPLAQFLAELSFPASYQVFLVNASDHDIAEITMQSSGNEGRYQLNVLKRKLGSLERGKALLLEELDYGIMDMMLWYQFDITFRDSAQLKSGFNINKIRSLRPEIYRLCPALEKDAYHFVLEPRS